FSINFRNRIGAIPNPTSLTSDNDPFVIRNPTLAQREAICGNTQFVGNFSGVAGGCLDAPIVAIVDSRQQNLADTRERGLDASVDYNMPAGSGALRFGLNATYLFEYALRGAANLPIIDVVNTE